MIILLIGFPSLLRQRPITPLAKPPAHGVSFILEIELTKTNSATNDLAAFKDALLKRSERLGLRIYCEPISDSQVQVAIGVRDSRNVTNLQRALFREGRLELRLVQEDSERMVAAGEVPAGYEILNLSGDRRKEQLIVKKKPEAGLTGSVIKEAMVMRGESGEPQIAFTMRPEAAAAFARVTRDNVGQRLAIVIDGELYSAPKIQSPIETGSGQITGSFDVQEAFEIASQLDRPLPAPVKVVEAKQY